jgi:hypothetical protein
MAEKISAGAINLPDLRRRKDCSKIFLYRGPMSGIFPGRHGKITGRKGKIQKIKLIP